MNSPIIEINNLRKSYGKFEAVRSITMEVPRGTISGFLGQNGAGKSSTIKMLLGMMKPTSGTGRIFDLRIDDAKDSIEIRKRTAFAGEDKRLYDYMTVEQIIRFTRAFFPNWREDFERKLLTEFRLPLDRKIKNFPRECERRPHCFWHFVAARNF